MLCKHFIKQYNQTNSHNVLGVEARAMDRLKQHDFPGNVRELKHLVEFGCSQTRDGRYVVESCFSHLIGYSTQHNDANDEVDITTESNFTQECGSVTDLKAAIQEYEQKIIRERLVHFHGDRSQAAESLGIPKRTLAYKCQKLGITA